MTQALAELFSLRDEIAVVLGGTGVLGGAMASALAGAGARCRGGSQPAARQ